MNIIEQRIWDYLDGTCNPQERKAIEHLIETDPLYAQSFRELKLLNEDLSAGVELDEPSMSFTRNVMEKIALEPVPGSIKSLIDKRIIYGIAAFFVVTIAALLVVLLSQVDWAQPVKSSIPQYKVPEVDFSQYFNSTFLKTFFFADIVLGLYMLDSVLRKRMFSK